MRSLGKWKMPCICMQTEKDNIIEKTACMCLWVPGGYSSLMIQGVNCNVVMNVYLSMGRNDRKVRYCSLFVLIFLSSRLDES